MCRLGFGYAVMTCSVVLVWLEFRKRNRIVLVEESLISSRLSSEEEDCDGDSTGCGWRFRDVVFGSPTIHRVRLIV